LSIKETLDEAKKEFSSDEQMLASAFKLEKFYKNHKIKIFLFITVVILFFGSRTVMETIEESKLNSANEAYLTLTKDENNTEALEILEKKNPALFELYSYKKAVESNDKERLKTLSNSNNEFISDMSAYHLSIIEGKMAKSQLYQEIAVLNNAHILIKDKKIDEAKSELDLIDEKSPVYNISSIIKHYSIKGN
jgi:predicted negative regulator of RcsB-dependent stress response